ncbi:hypothetical protein AURDEDRAFT_129582 [Auricularia subglabra TFB-10046 SS5]|nr:hypothetical protein AURDEDRAFT_129582 [Auricularia subglabra TFB-10046 SS5]
MQSPEMLPIIRATLDEGPSATKMPPELLCKTARYMPYADAWNAVNVNRQWWATLLADHSLWAHVAVQLATAPGAWLPAVTALMARSGGRPLTIEIQCDDMVHDNPSPKHSALERVARFLAGQMSCIKSLSLTIPSCETAGWRTLLRKRAPLLEVFRVHNSTFLNDTPRLAIGLFGGHAPRLRTLRLEQTYFPLDFEGVTGAALRGVTALAFHTSGALQPFGDLPSALATVMPNLRELTCTVLEDFQDTPYVPLALDLRVNVADGIDSFVSGFPRARSVVYSYAGVTANEMLDVVDTAVRAQGRITSLAIAWAPVQASVFWLAPPQSTRHVALSVNGRTVVVDITPATLHAALTPALVSHVARSVRTLAVVEEMWDVFAAADMPELRYLTLSLRARADWAADGTIGSGRQHKLDALRLVHAPAVETHASLAVPASAIKSFIRAVVLTGTSPVLYLSGLSVTGDGSDFTDNVARVVSTDSPGNFKGSSETWSWALSKDKRIVVQ